MRLLIVSHTAHYERDGAIVGWGPTVREIGHLSRLFDEVVHVAPLHDGPAPASSLPYAGDRVRLRAVSSAGGPGIRSKLGILASIPEYVAAISAECRRADAVHVRCPANIALVACVLLALRRRPRPRWLKYAGNWRPAGPEAWSYTLQRWWLGRGLSGGLVTVNGHWPGQRPHVRSFLNPCLTAAEIVAAGAAAHTKRLDSPIHLLFVGALNRPKGVGRALEILSRLRRAGLDATLDLVGDGPDRPAFEHKAEELGVAGAATFRGWLPRTDLGPVYERAHILLHPSSSSEGWPKVLSEAMAYGVVPVAGAVSSIPEVLHATGAGMAVPPDDLDGFAAAIGDLAANPERWLRASRAGSESAAAFTYDAYLEAVQKLFGEMGAEQRGQVPGGERTAGQPSAVTSRTDAAPR
jgi:glycosyltransferase involved in cell wall biosynthesis